MRGKIRLKSGPLSAVKLHIAKPSEEGLPFSKCARRCHMGQQWPQEGPSTSWMEQVQGDFSIRKDGPGIFKFRNVKILFRSFCPRASSPPWLSSFDNICLHIVWMSDASGRRDWGSLQGQGGEKREGTLSRRALMLLEGRPQPEDTKRRLSPRVSSETLGLGIWTKCYLNFKGLGDIHGADIYIIHIQISFKSI